MKKIPGIITVKKQGLYCAEGNFFIDARQPVPLNLITHAHSDHATFGHHLNLTAEPSLELLQYRLGPDTQINTFLYGEKFKLGNCWVSFHPAGHILGSSQIRIETKNSVCVVSGDYKRSPDATCEPFEVVPCDTFVTESTFGLPIYHWEPNETIAKKIYGWWQENRQANFASVLYCYALGKAQRILSLLALLADRPIYVHGAILPIAEIYRKKGIQLAPFLPISESKTGSFLGELILAPPIAKGSPWLRRFYPYKTALASGWMAVRGMRKQRNVDTGFAISDHADWRELLKTIQESKAKTVLTIHGNTQILADYLQESGWEAFPLKGIEQLEEEAAD